MDGEAAPDELRGALDAASRDSELRAAWERMHFASAVMQGALATSEAASKPAASSFGTKRRRWAARRGHRPRLRLGPSVAAAVAVLAALTVVLIAGLMGEEDAPNLVAGSTPATPAPVPADGQPAAPEAALAPIDRRRMNAYLLQHARYNAAAGTAGIPLARVLGDSPTVESEGD